MKRVIYFLVCIFIVYLADAQSCSQSTLTTLASNTTINSGQTSTLTHTGCVGGKVVWTNASNAVISNLVVTPTVTSTYKATCTFSANDVCTSSVTISVFPACTITALATKTAITLGENTTLSATGCTSGTVSWRDTDGNTLTNLTVSPQTATNYVASCTYPNGQSCTSAVSVTVGPTCFIEAYASSAAITSGESATLFSTGCEGGTVSWTANNATITNLTVSPTANTTYSVKCTYANGNNCTDNFAISVVPVCAITAAASVSNINAGQSSSLSATGCSGGQVTWFDSQNNSIGNASSISVNPTVTSTYKAICKYNSTGGQCSSEVTVAVAATCSVTASASNTTITNGQSTVLSYTGCANGIVSWKNGTTNVTNLVVNPTATTTYTATCANGSTANCTSNVTITVNASCGLSASVNNISITLGQSTTLSATGCLASSPAVWKNSAGQSITSTTITPSTTGVFTYTATCATSTNAACVSNVSFVVNPACTITASATDLNITNGQGTSLTSTGCVGGSATWQDASNVTLTSLFVKPTQTTAYKVTCSYSGITTTCSNSVTINVAPICNIVAKATKITTTAGTLNSFTLSQTGCGTGGTPTWSTGSTTLIGLSPTVNPTTTTTYKVVCSYGPNANTCESSVTVKGYPACTLNAATTATTVTAGTSITLSNTGCTGGTVRWKDDTGNLLNRLTFKPSSTRSYTATCSYEGTNTCTSVVSVTVTYAITIGTITSVKPSCGNVENASLLVPISRGIAGSETGIKLTLSQGTTTVGTYFTSNNSFAKIDNLKSGAYTLKVETLNGTTVLATANGTHTIQNGDNVAFTSTVVDVKCFGGADGEIKLTASGGKTPYGYDFDNLNKYTAFDATTIANIKKLKTDTLIVKVKDSQGCVSAVSTITVSQPKAALVATITSQVNPLGFETKDGQATVSVTGGTPDYSFEWADSTNTSYGKGVTTGTTNKNSTLRGGTYTVKVFDKNYTIATDKAGCTTTKSVKLVEPPQLKIAFTPDKQPSCSDRADGKFSVALTGGVPFDTGIKYKLLVKHKSSDYQDNDKLIYDFVPGGIYSLTITDKNNISRILEFTLPAPTPVIPKIVTVKNSLCNGDKSGALEIAATGGTEPYTAKWNNNLVGLSLTGLSAGKYIGLVYDAKQCESIILVEIKQPQKLDIKFDVFQPPCADTCTGTLKASIIGGTTPYTYTWADGNKTSLSLTKLCHETVQTLSVTDKNQCVAIVTNKMPLRSRLVIPLEKEKSICNNSQILLDAFIVNAKSYLWTSPSGLTAIQSRIIPDQTGLYKISVKDSLDCEFKTTVNVQQSSFEVPKITFTAPSVVGLNEKFVLVNLLNPLPKNTTWVLPVVSNDVEKNDFETLLSLPKLGEYEVGMQAVYAQCDTYNTLKIKVIQGDSVANTPVTSKKLARLNVGSNPSNGRFLVDISFDQETDINAEVWDLNANAYPVFEYKNFGKKSYNFDVDLTKKSSGTYLLIIKDQNNFTSSKKLVVIK